MDARLIVALPNGSMQRRIIEWFAKAGINLPVPTRRHWIEIDHPLILKIVWMRPQVIPNAISDGMVDAGITGEDCHWEWSAEYHMMLSQLVQAGFGRNGNQPVRIALVASKDEPGFPAQWEEIISEYPCWTQRVLQVPQVRIKPWAGSVEAFIPKRYGFGVTVVDTEESLRQNNLKIVRVLAVSHISLFFCCSKCESEMYGTALKLAALLKEALE